MNITYIGEKRKSNTVILKNVASYFIHIRYGTGTLWYEREEKYYGTVVMKSEPTNISCRKRAHEEK